MAEVLSFVEWMHRALHDPDHGYYTRQIRSVGRSGDFSTSASISTVLGEAIASWLREQSAQQPEVRTIVEIGGGGGNLMRSVRDALGWWRRRKFRFVMVEASPVLKAEQEKALKGADVRWCRDVEEALSTCGGKAFLFHNELLDAFPVQLLEWNAEQQAWQEIQVTEMDGRWTERAARRPLNPEEKLDAAFHALTWRPPANGQRVELGTTARSWMQEWAPQWRAGAMLTLDYGDAFPQLYHRRPRGTLRAYQMHQLFTGQEIYENMGRRDITADVNFSDLRLWGETLQWQNGPLETQREFLRRHLRDFDRRVREDHALNFLTAEHGAGTEFKVLVQRPAGTGS